MLVHAMNRGDNLGHIAHKSRGLAPNELSRLHASLTRNPTPSQQRQLCTSDLFGSISGQARSRIRPSCVVDEADAAEQVHLCTRYSRLCRWVLRRWARILEFSLTARIRISPELRAAQSSLCFCDHYAHVNRGRSPWCDAYLYCTGLPRTGTYYDACEGPRCSRPFYRGRSR